MGLVQREKNVAYSSDLLKRQDYLVTQGNDLAKAFGNLTILEQKILDFCFSFVQKDDDASQFYETSRNDIIKNFRMQPSKQSDLRINKAFRALREKTAIYLLTNVEADPTIKMMALFDEIAIAKSGKVTFHFSESVRPYVFKLKANYYSFKLSELEGVKSKHTLTLMKLWNSFGHGSWEPKTKHLPDAVIDADLMQWESWFLGGNANGKLKARPAGAFKRDILLKALKELHDSYKYIDFDLTTKKAGVKTVGYRLVIKNPYNKDDGNNNQ